ncbi:MAG TPA: alpha/beta hydrolase [Solirubrobacterales bacterium]|jgi:pimeloyl-ACP methyl ester carboxylesterase
MSKIELYHEVHGSGRPLVLLHGAMSTIETSFGAVLPQLAKTRRVIAIEQQAHGRTPDVDRSLSYPQMATDTIALLERLGVESADFFGYSMGAGIAVEIAIRNPALVGKLVLASLYVDPSGVHPGLQEQIEEVGPEDLAGTPFERAYAEVAPDPGGWAGLVAKVNELDREFTGWPREQIEAIEAPTLVIIGDSDIVTPEHAVALFRRRGGGVEGVTAGMPDSQLAILPGTNHMTIVDRADWLVSMATGFLDN